MYSFFDLAMSGKLNDICLGVDFVEVVNDLGEPNFKGGGSNKNKWEHIWRYQSLELIFDQKTRKLVSIGVDYFGDVEWPSELGGGSFSPWAFTKDNTLSEVIRKLKEAGIEYAFVEDKLNEECCEVITKSGVYLIFDTEEKLAKMLFSGIKGVRLDYPEFLGQFN